MNRDITATSKSANVCNVSMQICLNQTHVRVHYESVLYLARIISLLKLGLRTFELQPKNVLVVWHIISTSSYVKLTALNTLHVDYYNCSLYG